MSISETQKKTVTGYSTAKIYAKNLCSLFMNVKGENMLQPGKHKKNKNIQT